MDPEVERYFDAVPADRRSRLRLLHTLIVRRFPDVRIDLRYRMPTYTRNGAWVAIANQKHYVSLYTCDPIHLEAFRRSHPAIKTGKGCINLRDGDVLPRKALVGVIEHALLHPSTHRR